MQKVKLTEFLEEYQNEIAASIVRDFPPMYTFDKREKYVEDVKRLKRTPYLAQFDAIAALAELLSRDESASAITVGEMGVGKTICAIGLAYVCRFKRILVIAPPHLTLKWGREIKITMPDNSVECHYLKKFTDVDKTIAVANASKDKFHVFIVGRERAKLSYQWRPAYNWKKLLTYGKERKVVKFICCPRCGETVLDKDGIPVDLEDVKKKKLVCTKCKEPMWQAKETGPRRFAIAEYIKRKHRKFFDLLVIDECFPAGVKVETKRGKKNIEDIRVGEFVLSFNGSSLVYKKVIRIFKKITPKTIIKIKHDDGELLCTENHKIYTGVGKIRADRIAVNDEIYCVKGGNEYGKMLALWKKYHKRWSQVLLKRMFRFVNDRIPKGYILQEVREGYGSLSWGKKEQKILFGRMSVWAQEKKIPTYKSVRRMWQGYNYNKFIQAEKAFLQHFLFGKMENGTSRNEGEYSNDGRAKAKNWREAKTCTTTESRAEKKHIKENEAKQSDETTRSTKKGIRSNERKAISCKKRRQGKGPNYFASVIRNNSRMADGGYDKDRKQKNAILLQCRFSGRVTKDSSRMRRNFAQNVEGDCTGQNERRDTTKAWLDCAKIQERRNIKRYKQSGFRNKRLCSKKVVGIEAVGADIGNVYNIEVEGTHNYFADNVLVANCHEYRGRGTAQGAAAGNLASVCKKSLGLTGTLAGGYASSIFHLLYRITKRFKDDYSHDGVTRWIEDFGILERVTKYKDDKYSDNTSSKGKKYSSAPREKPGISPVILPKYLLDKTVFVRLSDIAIDLPTLTEEIVDVKMSTDQTDAYNDFYDDLRGILLAELKRGNKSLLAVYLQSLLTYPDRCTVGEQVYNKEDVLIASAPALNGDILYPKEQAIINLIKKEKVEGRKVLVFCTHTNRRDVTARLQEKIQSNGNHIRSEILKASIPAEKREGWIKEHAADVDCLITNPALVQTGLDLIEFPTIAYCQSGYSVYTLRQSSRRSWRIGQDKPVKIFYFVYNNTMQEQALKLLAMKMKASLVIEGDLGDDGLATYNVGDDNLFYELARNIANNVTIDEGFDTIWNDIHKKEKAGSDLLIESLEDFDNKPDCLNGAIKRPVAEIKRKYTPDLLDKMYSVMMQERYKEQDLRRKRREKREEKMPADRHTQVGLF